MHVALLRCILSTKFHFPPFHRLMPQSLADLLLKEGFLLNCFIAYLFYNTARRAKQILRDEAGFICMTFTIPLSRRFSQD